MPRVAIFPIGLWVIYGLPSNYTVVMKVDAVYMKAQRAWNISIDNHKFGEMFIACGVLYAVHNVTDTEMRIRYVNSYNSLIFEKYIFFNAPGYWIVVWIDCLITDWLWICIKARAWTLASHSRILIARPRWFDTVTKLRCAPIRLGWKISHYLNWFLWFMVSTDSHDWISQFISVIYFSNWFSGIIYVGQRQSAGISREISEHRLQHVAIARHVSTVKLMKIHRS